MDVWDLPRPARECRIVVAMSGGVDSSVVAALARDTGAEVVGVTLKLGEESAAPARAKACCAGRDILDAQAVARRLGIAHYVFDYRDRFRTGVVQRFADDYAAGRTPVPCIRCNEGVKFSDLLGFARELGADCLATGHYVQRTTGPSGPELHRGADPARDQSYFLFATTPAQLDYLRFPLGGLPKARVREMAAELGLSVAAKPDSQDICFVPDGDYAAVVRRLRPDAVRPGEIVDEAGRVLGRHEGLMHFTVGQRRGLDLGGRAEPLYVLRLEPGAGRVVVGPRRALAVCQARLSGLNRLGHTGGELAVKVRSLAKLAPAALDGDTLRFAEPEHGVAPGQAAVLYRGSRVLGGGWIEETRAAALEPA